MIQTIFGAEEFQHFAAPNADIFIQGAKVAAGAEAAAIAMINNNGGNFRIELPRLQACDDRAAA